MHVDAIIAALNEEKTIERIVRLVKKSSFIRHVIVISDGSTDKTVAKARAGGADFVLEHIKTQGKCLAIMHAFQHSNADALLLLDADLQNLSQAQIEQIVFPIVKNESDMNVALRDRGIPWRFIQPYVAKISGQRAVRRTVLEDFDAEYLDGYMFETALNYHARLKNVRITYTFVDHLNARVKMEKQGLIQGLKNHTAMIFTIIKAHLLFFPQFIRKKYLIGDK